MPNMLGDNVIRIYVDVCIRLVVKIYFISLL